MGYNDSLRAMNARLGNINYSTGNSEKLGGIGNVAQQLNAMGGFPQQDRMIRDKYYSLLRALKYSYQGAWIKKLDNYIEKDDIQEKEPVRALINPNKLKMEYDDKILSVPFDAGIKIGDIFEWVNTGTYWLVELQDLEELAYFKGEVRKCNYSISWCDEGVLYSTYAAIRGPVETKINFAQKHGISVDSPNYSLYIRMPANEHTLKQFQRYSEFYLQDIVIEDRKICWRVEATDSVSTPGLLEITAVEYFANEHEDDLEKGIVGGLIFKNTNSEAKDSLIVGENIIKPKKFYEYKFIGETTGEWLVDNKNVKLEIIDKKIKIKWDANYSGSFILSYGDYTKEIIVESLF